MLIAHPVPQTVCMVCSAAVTFMLLPMEQMTTFIVMVNEFSVTFKMARHEVAKTKAERQGDKELEKEKGVKRRRKYRPGMHALAEIHKHQKLSDILIRRLLFARYCLKIYFTLYDFPVKFADFSSNKCFV